MWVGVGVGYNGWVGGWGVTVYGGGGGGKKDSSDRVKNKLTKSSWKLTAKKASRLH